MLPLATHTRPPYSLNIVVPIHDTEEVNWSRTTVDLHHKGYKFPMDDYN